jgi:ABC-type iron transport system FetAB ATPase subunit
VFKHPAEVVDSRDFDRAEKTKILKQWELDARLLQVATEEGMGGGEHSLFSDVKKAQQRLDVDHLREDGAPTKAGP